MTRKEKEIIRKIENLIITTKGKTKDDDQKLCFIMDALWNLRRCGVDSAQREVDKLIKLYHTE